MRYTLDQDYGGGDLDLMAASLCGAASAPLAVNITGVQPASGAPGSRFTVSGSGFGAVQSDSALTLGGMAAPIVSWSDAQIVATVPALSPGSYAVAVYGVSGPQFNVVAPPVPHVSSIDPQIGKQGSTVTISGSNFGPPEQQGSVSLNGVSLPINSWSDTGIRVTIPPFTFTGPFVVQAKGGTAQSPVFTVIPPPFISVVSPASTVPGSVITITGSSFGVAQVDSTLTLGNTNLTVASWSDSQIMAVIPDGAVSGQIQVTVFGMAATASLNVIPIPGNGIVTSFQYDSRGQLISVTDPRGNTTSTSYTPAGLLQQVTDAQGNSSQFQYDGSGNRTSATDALQNTTAFTYDAMNRLTQVTFADGSSNQFAYDVRGRRTSVTDGNGRTTSYSYDDADRATSVTDAAANVTQYGYDSENNLTAITDANNNKTLFSYDAFGRTTQTTFPSGLSESYSYDANNNLLTKTDRNQNTISYAYDALNRLVQKQYPDKTSVNYNYDLANRLTQVSDSTGTYGFSYDVLGRLTGTSTQYNFLPGKTFSMSYGYDAASNRTSVILPDGSSEAYTYDTLNRLTSLSDSVAGAFGFTYDALGRRTSLGRPNGVNTSFSYDSLSRLLSALHQNSTTTLDGATYTYDNAGNRTSKLNQLNGVTEQYSYDAIYQLLQVTQGTTTTESYTYDAVGNRLTSGNVPSYTYNSSNELISSSAASYAYDNNGNTLTKMISGNTTQYTWDFENRLSSVALPGTGGTVAFKYDPSGRRIQKAFTQGSTTTTKNYVYDGANTVEEVDQSGNLLARYTQGAGVDEPLVELRSGTSALYEQDGLGSVTSLTGSTGAISNSYVYGAFGNLTASTSSLVNPFQFTGRDYDSETGLRYYRARYYDSQAGRFLSEDPIGFDGGFNFYSYVNNNPTGLIDPTGLCPPQSCDEWVKEILNLAAEVSRRFMQYEYPMGFLQMTGPNSRKGHWDQLEQKQRRLRREINDYNNSNCPDPIPVLVLDLATRPLPVLNQGPSPVHAPPGTIPMVPAPSLGNRIGGWVRNHPVATGVIAVGGAVVVGAIIISTGGTAGLALGGAAAAF